MQCALLTCLPPGLRGKDGLWSSTSAGLPREHGQGEPWLVFSCVDLEQVGGYILGEFGNLIAGDQRSSPAVQLQLLHSKYHLCRSLDHLLAGCGGLWLFFSQFHDSRTVALDVRQVRQLVPRDQAQRGGDLLGGLQPEVRGRWAAAEGQRVSCSCQDHFSWCSCYCPGGDAAIPWKGDENSWTTSPRENFQLTLCL